MLPALRLATSSQGGRKVRSGLLIAAVALSAALVVAVSSAVSSVNASLGDRMKQTVGVADLAVRSSGSGKSFGTDVLDEIRSWPEVARAEGIFSASISAQGLIEGLTPGDTTWERGFLEVRATALAFGIEPSGIDLRPVDLVAGRLAQAEGEIVIDQLLAERLSWRWATAPDKKLGFAVAAGASEVAEPIRPVPMVVTRDDEAGEINSRSGVWLGDVIEMPRLFRDGVPLEVVGIAAQPPLGGRPQAYMTVEGLRVLKGEADALSEVLVVVAEGVDPEALQMDKANVLGDGLILKTTEKITAGVDRSIRSSQLGLILASVLAFLSASFIVMTGLTTDVTQRQRELAVLRCIGATRRQLVVAQVGIGLLLGVLGAAIGVPMGLAIAWTLIEVFRDQVPGGLSVPWFGIVLAVIGSVGSGLLGAVWPAWRTGKLSPLEGLGVRARPATRRGVLIVTGFGLLGLAIQFAIVKGPTDGQVVFWLYATMGLPALFIGYFLLGVPAVLVVTRVLGGVIGRALGLPPRVLRRTIEATPYRHGFTAGALMAGLGMMVGIWTEGGAVMRDWLGTIQFPDAFVSSLFLTEGAQAELDAMDFVEATCAITIEPVDIEGFGIEGLQDFATSFLAFEPRSFFDMVDVQWVQGSEAEAVPRLEAGGSVIVAREFLIAQGLGLGDTFVCKKNGNSFEFEIVGVVTSPGIELVSKFFNVGAEFEQQAVHAVFGSRDDLKTKLGSDAIHLIQIDLRDDVDDAEAMATIRDELFEYAILDAGSGREIRDEIVGFITQSLVAMSSIAIASMLIASLGVANLIAAGIEVRKFEFGVLRSVGATKGLIARLVLAEAIVVALAAGVLGSLMGLQGVLAGQRIYKLLMGMEWRIIPPWNAIALGFGIVIALSLIAAGPAVWRLSRRAPRELLASPA